MPAGSGAHSNAADDFVMAAGRQHATGAQQVQNLANGYYSASGNVDLAKRSGSPRNSSAPATPDQTGIDNERQNYGEGKRKTSSGPKTVRDLSEKIDLMPPLSLEQGTKKLILAKKLDRENLDKYAQSSANPLSQSSSASLTVHIKCQLKARHGNDVALTDRQQSIDDHKISGNKTSDLGRTSTPRALVAATSHKMSKDSHKANSILIPVHLIITDENDNWPSFSAGPYIIDLNETAQIGSLLQNNEILAYDNDQPGPLSTIEYSILQGSFWSESFGFLNPLDSRSLIVKDNRLLDYESQPKITLKVMARDQGDPPNWAITSLYVNLLDQDDMNPVFNEDKYSGVVRDNRPGEKIDLLPRRMVAYDGDKTLSAPITYSFYLRTNHSIHFDLDPDLGQLTLKKTLSEIPDSFIANQPFCLLIKASQVDNPRRWSLTSVSIKLGNTRMGSLRPLDLNDQILSFGQNNYTVEISEAASLGSTIFIARTNHRQGVTYQLLDNDLGYFDIDQNTGRLTLNKSLDYEMFRQLSVRILATTELVDALDDYSRANRSNTHSTGVTTFPRLACDITRVNVKVLNFNDYSPEFSHDQYNFQLSISDLIANFEPESSRLDQDLRGDQSGQLESVNKITHRFGEIELGDDSSDDFDQKAIQLGQVYCADRDFGDKVSLHLTGSRANLFHLTQDGRLYLPLINASSLANLRAQANRPTDYTGTSKWGTKSPRPMNNQFVMNRIFSSVRRSDEQQRNTLDRSHLNYLLSELSNLGRLRLKVHATDSGQPDAKQSTALIVISIISIDNFIIQRSPSSALNNHDGELIQLSNDTSYQTMAKSGSDALSSPDRGYSNQLMMIPSMNGKSFVHINPDIIGNLLSSSTGINNYSSKTDSNDRSRSQLPDVLESSASNTVSNSVDLRDGYPHSPINKYQPPGLLLVDDEGAKFVAMPTAMEVYNQQVQEAAGQQARQRSKQNLDSDSGTADRKSSWFHIGDNLGLHSESGIMRWINLSTAIALHLVIIACILSLVTRIRSMIGSGDGRSNIHPNVERSSNIDRDSRWPKRISNLSSFFVEKQSDSVTNILDQHSASTHDPTTSGVIIQSDQYSRPQIQQQHHQQFQRQNHNQNMNLQETKQSAKCRQQSIVSSGVVVSARSNGSPETTNAAEISSEARNQQNLFEHLKLTLNKMLDTGKDEAISSNMGHISFRPLDSDVVSFEDQRDRQLEIRAQLKETTELKSHEQINPSPMAKSPISTFIGANHRSAIAQHDSVTCNQNRTRGPKQAPTVVSINVAAPKQRNEQNSCLGSKVNNSGSSNSSVVSLVSASSSLSNKISQAVGRVGSLRTNGSDSTSLNSSILLQGFAGSSSSASSTNKGPDHRTVSAKLPPVPPPLPPPPSLVKASVQDGQRNVSSTAGQSKMANATSPRSLRGVRPDFGTEATRRQPPENPTHLRLRRDAVVDQLVTIGHSSNSFARDHHQNNNSKSVNYREINGNRSSRSSSAVSGRRETRNQQATQMSPQHISTKHIDQQPQLVRSAAPSDKITPTSSNKTVSPTTSVDRGYESFQSFGYQPSGRQFSSLQEYPQSCMNADCEQFVASLPDHNLDRRMTRLRLDETNNIRREAQATRKSRTGAGPASFTSPTRDKTQMIRGSEVREFVVGSKPDCDTEDDDFYYYCGESVHADEHQLGCLTYSNHAYNQPTSFCQAEQHTKSSNCTNRRPQNRRASNGKHSIDLMHPGNQLGTTSQICDMTRGRRSQQNLGRSRNMASQSSQLTGEISVKKLTWSDQVS